MSEPPIPSNWRSFEISKSSQKRNRLKFTFETASFFMRIKTYRNFMPITVMSDENGKLVPLNAK